MAFVETSRNFSTNQIYTANYDKQFDKHAVNLLAGYEHYYYKESAPTFHSPLFSHVSSELPRNTWMEL